MYPLTIATVIADRSIADELGAALQNARYEITVELSEVGEVASLAEKLAVHQSHVLLLDLSASRGTPAEEAIRQLRATIPELKVVALSATADPSLILSAMRAGASEFLYLPFGEQLSKLLSDIASERQKRAATQGKQGKVIGCLGAKGGCGTSTLACHIAAGLPQQTKQEALLVDLDLQTGLLAFLVKSKSPYTVLDAAANVHRLDQNYWKRLVSNGIPGLEIMTAPAPLTSQEVLNHDNLSYVLRFARSQYNWVVLDMGRSLTPLTLTGVENVDELLLVTTPEVPALHLAKHIVQKLKADGLREEAIRLVLNRMPKNPEITVEELEKALGIPAYYVLPNDYPSLNGSYSEGKLLPQNSALGRGIAGLTARVAGIQPLKEKRKFKLFG